MNDKKASPAVTAGFENGQPEKSQLAKTRILYRGNGGIRIDGLEKRPGLMPPGLQITVSQRCRPIEQRVMPASAEERLKTVIKLQDVGMLEETLLVLLIAVLRANSKPRA